ncbi:MAG: c-type cytochrome [Candidatus Kryptonium sp.]|nr:c-type cytochrome [Candidatus Kryptonium sp.]MCX7762788.1 c-type cytochrome [Candidatus Kryptonium sp.]MDW8108044.1 c-type cytochrome [Candidatus Kryptonium sp.]
MRNLLQTLMAILMFVSLSSCSRDQTKNIKLPEDVKRGREIFYDSNYGTTGLACANCHADFDDVTYPDDKIRPGHNLIGAHRRKITWYGKFRGETLKITAGGAGLCIVLYQKKEGAVNPLKALSPEDSQALLAYFEFISGEIEVEKLTSQPLVLPWDDETTRKEKINRIKDKILNLSGNPENGAIIYEKACEQCHLEEINIGPPILFTQKITAEKIIEMIRAGSSASSETPMPFFTPDKLSDQEIADLIAYIVRLQEK